MDGDELGVLHLLLLSYFGMLICFFFKNVLEVLFSLYSES